MIDESNEKQQIIFGGIGNDMPYLMGIDIGTTNLKVLAINEHGDVLAKSAEKYDFLSPSSNWAEQDPSIWWEACCKAIRGVLRVVDPKEIAGIGFSGQMHGLVSLDQDARVIRPSILHCDARSRKQVYEIQERIGCETLGKTVLNTMYTGYLLPSLLWIRENEPENYVRIRHVLMVKDYIRYLLTGEILTDYSDASGAMAFDVRNGRWSKQILQTLGLDEAKFPRCVDAASMAGRVTQKAAEATGLQEGTPVACGGGDSIMQGVGNGVIGSDRATVNIGTSGSVLYASNALIHNGTLNLNIFCGHDRKTWVYMGAIMSAGLAYRWVTELLNVSEYKLLDARAERIMPGSDGTLFLPYLNGERCPHMNPALSGAFMGLGYHTDTPRLARSVMEGVCYALRQCKEICEAAGLGAKEYIASGGGSQSEVWLSILADVLGVPLKVSIADEQACLGAAIAAGVATRVYGSMQQGCEGAVKYRSALVEPNLANHEIYEEYYALYRETSGKNLSILEKLTALGKRQTNA